MIACSKRAFRSLGKTGAGHPNVLPPREPDSPPRTHELRRIAAEAVLLMSRSEVKSSGDVMMEQTVPSLDEARRRMQGRSCQDQGAGQAFSHLSVRSFRGRPEWFGLRDHEVRTG